ncbi:hypothetical protein [Shewanella algae]
MPEATSNQFKRVFISSRSRSEIDAEISMAERLIELEGTAFPDSTFEDGYIAALNYVLGKQDSNVREEFDQVMDERHEDHIRAEAQTA